MWKLFPEFFFPAVAMALTDQQVVDELFALMGCEENATLGRGNWVNGTHYNCIYYTFLHTQDTSAHLDMVFVP